MGSEMCIRDRDGLKREPSFVRGDGETPDDEINRRERGGTVHVSTGRQFESAVLRRGFVKPNAAVAQRRRAETRQAVGGDVFQFVSVFVRQVEVYHRK